MPAVARIVAGAPNSSPTTTSTPMGLKRLGAFVLLVDHLAWIAVAFFKKPLNCMLTGLAGRADYQERLRASSFVVSLTFPVKVVNVWNSPSYRLYEHRRDAPAAEA